MADLDIPAQAECASLRFVFPACADDTMSNFLRSLTAEIVERTGADTSYGLGGSNGYGCEWNSDVFAMHPYCWCERQDCAWCTGCDCPDACSFHDPDAFPGTGFEPDMGAPNFWHKPSGVKVWWYKYIGRGMEVRGEGDLALIANECLQDVARTAITKAEQSS